MKKSDQWLPRLVFFFASVFEFFLVLSSQLVLYIYPALSTSLIHAPLTIARTAASNLGESMACQFELRCGVWRV